MALYDIISGQAAVASDVEQLINIFNGKHDIGNLSFAPQLSAPSSGSFSLATQAGSSLGIGAYNYQFTYVTGQYKSDGVTLVQTGETTVSASKSITTTSGNTNVLVTLPTSSLPTSLVAINIYRTSVGGSDYKLIATVKAGSVNYTDSTSDASRGSQTPPSTNTTGTFRPYVYIRGGNGVWNGITSSNTLGQFPTASGGPVNISQLNGFHLSGNDIICDTGGKYILEAWATISGLNDLISWDLLIRRYYLGGGTYGDDINGTYGYSGLGSNYGSPEGPILSHKIVLDLSPTDKIQFYTRAGEAPRSINNYALFIYPFA